MIFSISAALDKANKILPASFVGLNIWERKHIEEWIRINPEILGENLLILTVEFDCFVSSSDRLDLLALDKKGNLVVVELKRDSAAGYADLQAIRYAAMVSSMTIEKLLPYYIAYRKRYDNEQIDEGKAIDQIVEFVESDFKDFSTQPRIILCSEGFSLEITTTVLWLRSLSSKIDISCVKITPYKVGEQLVIVPKVVIPLEEAAQYQAAIRIKEEDRESGRKNRPRTMRILVENALVKPGDIIYLKNGLPPYMSYEENNPVFQAVITGKLGQSDAVRWKKDDAEYAISTLAWKIFKDLHPEGRDPGGAAGTWNWVTSEGRSLWEIAEEFHRAQVSV